MDFTAISSIHSYMKNVELQQKWQKRKETNNFAPEQTMLEKMIEDQRRQAEGIPGTPQTDSQKMSEINTKIMNGRELSVDEMSYLQKHNPVMYQKLKAAEAEQESYERELKRCKTKEEVDRVKMSYVNASLSTINSTRNNTEIDEAQEFAIIMTEKIKMETIAKITAKFVASGRYADLPTDDEKLKAEKLMKDAKDEELRPDTEEKTQETENDAVLAEVQIEKTQKVDVEKAEAEKVSNDEEITVEKAEKTPEMQKLKRAKARAAYADTKSLNDGTSPTGDKLNVSI